jgi:hypothetical protein
MAGCALASLDPSAGVDEVTFDLSALRVRVVFSSADSVREATLDAGSVGLDLALTTSATAAGTTRTVRFGFGAATPRLTSQAAGFVEHDVEHVYTPTFWPAVDWVSAGPWGILLRQSTGVRFSQDGTVELLAVRDARSERCDVEGGTGSDPTAHRLEWRIVAVSDAGSAMRLAQAYNRPLEVAIVPGPSAAASSPLPAEQSLLSLDGAGVVTALKPADRGEGAIARVLLAPGPATLRFDGPLRDRSVSSSDLVERDGAPLGNAALVPLDSTMGGPLLTVRVH